jgi:hypothetical protein
MRETCGFVRCYKDTKILERKARSGARGTALRPAGRLPNGIQGSRFPGNVVEATDVPDFTEKRLLLARAA